MTYDFLTKRQSLLHRKKISMGWVLFMVVLGACRAQVKPQIREASPQAPKSSIEKGKNDSTETMAWFSNEPIRTHFQSHQIFKIRIDPEILGDATSLTLLNVTGLSLEDDDLGQPLLDHIAIPDVSSEKSGEIHVSDHPEVTLTRNVRGLWLKIYPLTEDQVESPVHKLLPRGEHRLKAILSEDESHHHAVYFALTVRDFPITGTSWTSTVSDEKSLPPVTPPLTRGGLRWWVNPMGNVGLSESKNYERGEITTGLHNTIK